MAEGGGLLNRYTLQRRIEGSNPSVSANFIHFCQAPYIPKAPLHQGFAANCIPSCFRLRLDVPTINVG